MDLNVYHEKKCIIKTFPKFSQVKIIKLNVMKVLTFSPETGSVTGSSTAACFRNTLPLVARNRILSNAIDFPLGTRPVRNPNLTCFDWSAVFPYTSDSPQWNIMRTKRCHLIQKTKIEFKICTCSSNRGVSKDSSPLWTDSASLCWAVALLMAEWKNSPAWERKKQLYKECQVWQLQI